jgi:flagellar hook assembly protein FlgD
VAATRLSFSVPTAGTVRVEVFNVAGQRVATLVNRALPAGRWEATWNGRSDEGASVSPGFYFARVTQGAESAAHKIVRMQ